MFHSIVWLLHFFSHLITESELLFICFFYIYIRKVVILLTKNITKYMRIGSNSICSDRKGGFGIALIFGTIESGVIHWTWKHWQLLSTIGTVFLHLDNSNLPNWFFVWNIVCTIGTCSMDEYNICWNRRFLISSQMYSFVCKTGNRHVKNIYCM